MRRLGVVLLVVVAVTAATAAACGGGSGGADMGDVTLNQSGGIAAVNRSVTVDSDGKASTGKQLEEPELERLRQLLEQAAATDIQPTYVPDGFCCDQFRYDLTAEVDGRTITTHTADGAAGPKVVEDIIGLLIRFLPTG